MTGSNWDVNKKASILRDVIFGANDGVITTFVVIAGSLGGKLPANIVVILGFANLIADGFSMASGIYLGARSEVDLERKAGNLHWKGDAPFLQGIATFLAFAVGGFVPLAPFVLEFENKILYSAVMMLGFLFFVGMVRSKFTGKNVIKSGLEMLLVGSSAAGLAYGVGYFIGRFVLGKGVV